jgi:hypothetical protein
MLLAAIEAEAPAMVKHLCIWQLVAARTSGAALL